MKSAYLKIIAIFFLVGANALAVDHGDKSQTATKASEFQVAAPKTFTTGVQEDYTKNPEASAVKGATALVWSKNTDWPRARVEIYRKGNPGKALSFVTESHVFHTMVYFDKPYEWRVRYLTAEDQPASEFSEPSEFSVLRKGANSTPYASKVAEPKEYDEDLDKKEPVFVIEADGKPVALSGEDREVAKKKKLKVVTRDKFPARLKQPEPFVVMQAPAREPQSIPKEGAAPEPQKTEPLFEDTSEENSDADFDY